MRARIWLVVWSMLAVFAGGVRAGDPVRLELTRDGKPTATIVVADKPTRAAQLAAAELQEHVRKISGATLPVASDTNKVKGLRILVGESKATQALGLHGKDFKPQEYLIRFLPDALVLMGRDKEEFATLDYNNPDGKTIPDAYDEQATCYAVYDFLERHCDVRWYLPTELGLVCPSNGTLRVTGSERRRMPWMENRTESLLEPTAPLTGYNRLPNDLIGTVFFGETYKCLPWREQALFARRLRLGGKRMSLGGHSFYCYYQRFWKKYPDYAQYFESARPEFFAKGYEGDPPQMCYTSPELVTQCVKDARDFFNGKEQRRVINEGSSGQDYFVLGAMDNCSWCQCPRCNAIIRKNVPPGSFQYDKDSISDYWFQFVNKVAREVKMTHPDKMLITLVYNAYVHPPVLEKLEPNVAIVPVYNPRRIWNTPEYDEAMKTLDAWVNESKQRQKYLWLHYLSPVVQATCANPVWYPFPGFFAHKVVQQMKMYKNDGFRGAFIEVSASNHKSYSQRLWLWDQLEMYVTWQLADDPEKDGNRLIDEFFERYYGAAAKPMKTFYEMVEEIYCNPNNYPYGAVDQTVQIAWDCLGTASRMEKLERLMDEAKAACRTETEKNRVALFDKGIWQVMCAGRNKYVEYKGQADATMQAARAPRCAVPAEGDPRKVDWSQAGILGNWRSFAGNPTARAVEARVAHDGARLYLRLQEQMDTRKIVRDGKDVWSGDDWELFIARRSPDYRYRQMAIDVHSRHVDYAYSPESSYVEGWESGAQVYSDAAASNCWNVYVALPLDNLLAGGDKIKTGDTIYLNIVRATLGRIDDSAMWIPTLASTFHTPDRLGRIVLDVELKP